MMGFTNGYHLGITTGKEETLFEVSGPSVSAFHIVMTKHIVHRSEMNDFHGFDENGGSGLVDAVGLEENGFKVFSSYGVSAFF